MTTQISLFRASETNRPQQKLWGIDMAETLDFQSVMAELTNFQSAIGDIHTRLRSVKHKEILGDMLDKIQSARAEVEVEYPKAMNLIEDTARKVMAEAKQDLAKNEQKRAELDQKIAASKAAQPKAPKLPSKPEVKVDPALGQRLRTELLERFGPQTESNGLNPSKIREAWQDWE